MSDLSQSFNYPTKNGESSTSSRSSSPSPDDYESAVEDVVEQDGQNFTISHLRDLLGRASQLKARGNKLFTSQPPDYVAAKEAYQEAIELLPLPREPNSGLEEITDREAKEIGDRSTVERDIKACLEACWSNTAACHVALADYKAAVDACNIVLDLDPDHIKALNRRAVANINIGSWSSLSAAKEDYTKLLPLVPPIEQKRISKTLTTLLEQIERQQAKEKDEMLAKLKELGNGILGKFGLSTDMFKFDQQESGGYNMRFEK